MINYITDLAKRVGITDIDEYKAFESEMVEFAEKIARGSIEFAVSGHSKVTPKMINEDAATYIQSIK